THRPPHRRVLVGGDALRTADAPADLRRRRPPVAVAPDPARGAPVAAVHRPWYPAGAGDDCPEGSQQDPGGPLRHGPGTGGRLAALRGSPADPRPAAVAARASDEVGPPAPGGGRLGRRGAAAVGGGAVGGHRTCRPGLRPRAPEGPG